MRSIGSAHTDPFSSLAGAAAALYGPLHGGANEMVLRMLKEIGSVDKVPDYIKRVKAGEFRLMGFGHRVYKNYDPRARIIKQVAYEVFEVTGKDPLLDIALELERIALGRRVLRQAPALSERRFLLGDHLPGDAFSRRHVSGDVCDSANFRLAGAVGRAARRCGSEDRAPAPDLSRSSNARVRSDRSTQGCGDSERRGLTYLYRLEEVRLELRSAIDVSSARYNSKARRF